MARMQAALALLMMASVMVSAEAAIYHVGDSFGWNIPRENPNFFAEWANGKTFHVGDKLVFDFRSPGNNVLVGAKTAYNTCTQFDYEIFDYFYHGPAVIELQKPGDYYFISGIGRQCEVGVKLHVNVV